MLRRYREHPARHAAGKLTDKSNRGGSPQHIVDTLKQVETAGVAEVILYFNYGRSRTPR